MILQRVLSGAAAAGAALAAAGVVVVAAAYALYALAKPFVGPAGAAGIVALAFAVILGVGAAVAMSAAKGKRPKKPHSDAEPRSLLDRALEMARERPLVAAAGAVAAGLLAIRNPAVVAAALGLMNQPPRPRR